MEGKDIHFIDYKKYGFLMNHSYGTQCDVSRCGIVKQELSSFPATVTCQASTFNNLSRLNVVDSSLAYQDEQEVKAKLENERYRRQYYERSNHQLRRQLMIERQRSSEAISLQGDMRFEVEELQKAWYQFVQQWDVYQTGLSKNLQNYQGGYQDHNIQLNDSSNVECPSHDVNDISADCNEMCYVPDKKNGNLFCEDSVKNCASMKEVRSEFVQTANDTIITITPEETIELFTDIDKALKIMNDQFQELKAELFSLKQNEEVISSKLGKVNETIDTLNKHKIWLLNTLYEIKEKENVIRCKMGELSNHMNKIHFKQSSVHRFSKLEDSETALFERCNERDCLSFFNRFSSENLVDHQTFPELQNEEIVSYKLSSEQPVQAVEKLESEVACNYSLLKSFVADEDDLGTDGAKVKLNILECERRENSNCEAFNGHSAFYELHKQDGSSEGCENISVENGEYLQKNSIGILVKVCDDLRKEILSLSSQDMSEEFSERSSILESKVQQKLPLMKRDAEIAQSKPDELVKHEEELCGATGPILREEINYLSYGSALAYSYFYGYLKLILPVYEFGTEPKGIKAKIVKYINAQHLSEDSFPLQKLIVLVPQMLDTPSNPQKLSTDEGEEKYWLEPAKYHLDAEVISRAGVTNRPYDVPVYKIKDPDKIEKPKYIAATVALKSLFDVVNMNPEDSSEIIVNLPETISSFCRTLEILLSESEDCRDLCEIICFTHKDISGKKVNIARLILQRIDELLAEKKRHHIHTVI